MGDLSELERPVAAGVTRPSVNELRREIERHLLFSIGKTPDAARLTDWRNALCHAIRDRVVVPWVQTAQRIRKEKRKRVYYLSLEFLMGRLLEDAISNIGFEEVARTAIEDLGLGYNAILADEPDAALGNGGLGRLAACFMESMSTIGLAAHGYGIRYDHGIFRQRFDDGWQCEEAEDWLREGHLWEFGRPEVTIEIGFGGWVEGRPDGSRVWRPGDQVIAAAYDTPAVGWQGKWVNTLRLWSAKPTLEFELGAFNRGDFIGAAAPAVLAQTISRVL